MIFARSLTASLLVLSGCSQLPSGVEICGNFLDDNKDGLTDCQDTASCGSHSTCQSSGGDAGYYGDCQRCGRACTGQTDCLLESYANDTPLAMCTGGRCSIYNEPTYYNVRLNLPVALGNNAVAVVRVVQRKGLDGGAVDCAMVQAASKGPSNAIEESKAFNLSGWSWSSVAANSSFVMMNLTRTGTTFENPLVYAELWNGQFDSTTKFPTGTRVFVGCVQMQKPFVVPPDCDGGIFCYEQATVELRQP